MSDEGAVCKVWIIMECRCLAEDSKVRVYLSKVRKSKWQAARRFIKKAAPHVIRLFGAIALTYLYSVWSIEQAFIQRGYKAYGGEYLVIPFVFYGIYKVFGWIQKLFYGGVTYESLSETYTADTGGTKVCGRKSLGN